MNIGERIAFYRRQKGLRQEDLARQVGVSTQAVQELLAQPPEEQIEKLCEIFWMLQKSLIETKEVQWLFNSLGFIPERYEAIFRALGTPHAMDILFLLYSHTSALSQEGLARRLNLSPGALTQPLAALVSLDLVNVIEIESEQGVSRCYQSVGSSIIMALYFIRESLAEKHINLASFYTRTKPLLAEPGARDYAPPPSGNARKKQPGFVFKEKNKSGLFHTSLPPFCTTVIFCYSVDRRKILMILDLVTAILALAYVALFQTLHLVFLTLFILWVLNAITASSRHLLPNLSYCRYARSGV